MSAVAGQLKLEQDWSPLCEACLSKLKSAKFRDAVLERTKPLKYDIRIDEFVNGCVLCSLITRQLNYREPGSASRITIARVSISRWEEPSELYLSVNSSPSLSLNLFTRPSGHFTNVSSRDHPDLLQMILRLKKSLLHTKTSIHIGHGIKPTDGYRNALELMYHAPIQATFFLVG